MQKAPTFSQLPGAKNRGTDTAVVRERENITLSKRRHRQRGQVKRSIHIHQRRKPTVTPMIQFHHQKAPTETTLHLGSHGHVDAVLLQALGDSSFRNIHDADLGDASCRSSCGASNNCDAQRFSSLQLQSCPPHSQTHQTEPVS